MLAICPLIRYNNFRAPVITKKREPHKINAPLAQLVEHLTLNQGVQGSSPWRCTWESIDFADLRAAGSVLYFCTGDK